MKKSDFYFELPQELIAQTPIEKRDESRLLIYNKCTDKISHKHFYDIIDYLEEGDCLVLNNSRVLPARLIGYRETGGIIEILLLKDLGNNKWECLTKPGRKAKPGDIIYFGNNDLSCKIIDIISGGNRIVEFNYNGIFLELLDKLGKMPLPPYIKEELKDPERYQTVYSKEIGSAAAPTAGLHFTNELIEKIKLKGINVCFITLHVGLGTFRPVKEDNIEDHDMHSEYCEISSETADIINQTHKNGKRVVCVGTTSCRTLESFAKKDHTISESSGWTNIFIYPGYKFKIVDSLITNFHLPESTLIMLVSALAGKENILKIYNIAVKEKYRFFSFGDAMFIY